MIPRSNRAVGALAVVADARVRCRVRELFEGRVRSRTRRRADRRRARRSRRRPVARDPTGAGEVFGHSENTLYRVDTVTRSVTQVGVFDGCTYVADIALDESSNIYASTGTELFYVETNTAHCTRIATGTFPNSLSFVPGGHRRGRSRGARRLPGRRLREDRSAERRRHEDRRDRRRPRSRAATSCRPRAARRS